MAGGSETEEEGGGDDESTEQRTDDGASRSNADRGGGDRRSTRRQGISTIQKIVIVVTVAFTLFLFAYAGWEILTPPAAEAPQASVVETERTADGEVAVTVQVYNPKDVGLISVTVQSHCSSQSVQVQLSYVPASATRTGTVVCPPGKTDPRVSIESWMTR